MHFLLLFANTETSKITIHLEKQRNCKKYIHKTCTSNYMQTNWHTDRKKKLLHFQYRPTFNFWNRHTRQRCTVKKTKKPCFNRKWPLCSYLKSHSEQYVCVLLEAWHFPAKYRTVQCYHSLQLSACIHNYDGACEGEKNKTFKKKKINPIHFS